MPPESAPVVSPQPAMSIGVHKARPLLPQLIKDALEEKVTELTRGEERALLVSPAHATRLGVDIMGAPSFGIAEARPALGDLIARATAGTPQVLRRHKTPVAVLIHPGTPAPATAPPDNQSDSRTGSAPTTFDTNTPQGAARILSAGTATTVTDEDGSTASDPEHADSAPTGASPAVPAENSPTASDRNTVAVNSADPAADTQATGAPASAAPRRALAALADVLDTVLAPANQNDPAGAAGTGLAHTGLPTGIHTLDEAIGGLQPGRLYLVAGAPGTGASLLATAAARATALTQRRPVLYAASGLTRTDIAARVIASHTPVDYRRLRAGTLTDQDNQAVTATAQLLATAPLLIDDGTGLDAAALTDTATDVPDLALLVVDRLQAARDPRLPLSGPPAVRDAVQALAHLARIRHIPILAALDTDDPVLLRTLAPDLTLTLEHHHRSAAEAGEYVRLTIAERDLGTLGAVVLRADFAQARLTDLDVPSASAQAVPAAPAMGGPRPGGVIGHQPPAHRTAPTTALESPSANDTTAQEPVAAARAAHALAGKPSGDRAPYGGRDYEYYLDMIRSVVQDTLAEHRGDTQAAIAVLESRAIPEGMALFDATRVGANYEHTVYPERLAILSKKSRDGADDIWEGRHKWENTPLMTDLKSGSRDSIAVDVLDTNAAYCSALKTHLPIGALQHQPEGGFDPKRSGIYLLPKRPLWEHPHLPDPIGNRRESGPLFLDDATVRLLIRCHKLGLAQAPHITEAWTSGASESLLEKFRRVLNLARENALADGDEVTVQYVKAIYAKFVSTIGESTYNRDLRRPDWMHIIRSQAFANLWYKAKRAHDHGLTIVRLRGTDELHITGDTDWRTVFTEGRLSTQMKLKDQYTLPLNRKAA